MSGYFTRKMYDDCAYKQSSKQSTDPLELVIDITKYINCNNMCQPSKPIPRNSILLVDVESSLKGLDKTASNCDCDKHPFCGPKGCLLTNDPRIAPHITPYVCDRGRPGDKAVVTTNMRPPEHPGYFIPNVNICENQNNGYYSDPNRRNVNNINPNYNNLINIRNHNNHNNHNQYLNDPLGSPIQVRNQTIRNQHPMTSPQTVSTVPTVPTTIGQHLTSFLGLGNR